MKLKPPTTWSEKWKQELNHGQQLGQEENFERTLSPLTSYIKVTLLPCLTPRAAFYSCVSKTLLIMVAYGRRSFPLPSIFLCNPLSLSGIVTEMSALQFARKCSFPHGYFHRNRQSWASGWKSWTSASENIATKTWFCVLRWKNVQGRGGFHEHADLVKYLVLCWKMKRSMNSFWLSITFPQDSGVGHPYSVICTLCMWLLFQP